MKKCYGLWRLMVWLSTLIIVSSMPQRYQQDRSSYNNFKIFRLPITNNTIKYDYVTGANLGTVGGNKDDEIDKNFIQSSLPNLTKPNITVSLIKNKTVINTQRPSTNKIILKRPSVGFVQGGTVGQGPKITKKIPVKLKIPTAKPPVLIRIYSNRTKNSTWPYTTIKDKNDLEAYKKYTLLPTITNKQDIVLFHIPGPDPIPEVTSYSPQYETHSISTPPTSINNNLIPLSSVESFSNGFPDDSDDGIKLDIPIGNFDVDSSDILNYVPNIKRPNFVDTYPNGYPLDDSGGQILNIPLGDFSLDTIPNKNLANNCPTIHLSSNVFGAQMKQTNCPDLNLVLNNHYQQNAITEKIGTLGSLQSAPLEPTPQANIAQPLAAAPAQLAQAPGSQIATNGGSGGLPSLPEAPSLPEFPEFNLPSIKGLFDIISYLWRGGEVLFRLIWPILVAIPIAVFFKTLILTFFTLFPWWLPALFFAGGSEKKETDTFFYKHVHKPVVHPDGWFWNENSKTWINIGDYYNHGGEVENDSNSLGFVPNMIDEFKKKYYSYGS